MTEPTRLQMYERTLFNHRYRNYKKHKRITSRLARNAHREGRETFYMYNIIGTKLIEYEVKDYL